MAKKNSACSAFPTWEADPVTIQRLFDLSDIFAVVGEGYVPVIANKSPEELRVMHEKYLDGGAGAVARLLGIVLAEGSK